jgi:hypothetical protein
MQRLPMYPQHLPELMLSERWYSLRSHCCPLPWLNSQH